MPSPLLGRSSDVTRHGSMMSHILLLRIVRSCCRGSQGAPASIPEGEGPLPSSWAGGNPGLGGPDPLWCHQVLPDPLSPPCHQCQREPDEKAQWLLIDFRDVVCSEVGWGGRWVPDPQPTGTSRDTLPGLPTLPPPPGLLGPQGIHGQGMDGPLARLPCCQAHLVCAYRHQGGGEHQLDPHDAALERECRPCPPPPATSPSRSLGFSLALLLPPGWVHETPQPRLMAEMCPNADASLQASCMGRGVTMLTSRQGIHPY